MNSNANPSNPDASRRTFLKQVASAAVLLTTAELAAAQSRVPTCFTQCISQGKMLAMINYTWHILLVALAGWMNRQQQEMIEYLKEENRTCKKREVTCKKREVNNKSPRAPRFCFLNSSGRPCLCLRGHQ